MAVHAAGHRGDSPGRTGATGSDRGAPEPRVRQFTAARIAADAAASAARHANHTARSGGFTDTEVLDAYAALSKAALARGFGPVPEFGSLR